MEDPFNERRMVSSLGGQSYLHALVLTALPVESLKCRSRDPVGFMYRDRDNGNSATRKSVAICGYAADRYVSCASSDRKFDINGDLALHFCRDALDHDAVDFVQKTGQYRFIGWSYVCRRRLLEVAKFAIFWRICGILLRLAAHIRKREKKCVDGNECGCCYFCRFARSKYAVDVPFFRYAFLPQIR